MTTVTANNVLEGQLIGDWLVKTVDGKPCNVVELQGTVGASVAIDRKKGFADAIAKASNIKIIRSQSGDFTRSKGKEVMESFIKAENNGKTSAWCSLITTIWPSAPSVPLKKLV